MIYQLLINGGDAEKFWSAPPPAKISLIFWVFCGKFWSKYLVAPPERINWLTVHSSFSKLSSPPKFVANNSNFTLFRHPVIS